MKNAIAIALALAPLVAAAADSVPLVVGYSGRLMTGDGPVTAPELAVKFGLFDTDNPSKAAIWSETKSVRVQDGLLATVLGETTPIDAAVLDKPELYFSVSLGSTELLPRVRVTSSPFAMRAGRAGDAERVLAAGVDTAALKDNAVTLGKLEASLRNEGGKLNADTLDGLDSSAFAPADISGKIGDPPQGSSLAKEVASVRTTLGPGTGSVLAGLEAITTKLDGDSVSGRLTAIQESLTTTLARVGTPATNSSVTQDVAAVKGDTATIKADTATLKADTTTLKADTTTLKADVAAIKGAAVTRAYSLSCKDFAAKGWATKYDCLTDGRVHLVYANTAAGLPKASNGLTFDTNDRADLFRAIKEGAQVSVGEGADMSHRALCVDVTLNGADTGPAACSTAVRTYADWGKGNFSYMEANFYWSDGYRQYQHVNNQTTGSRAESTGDYRWFIRY